MAKNKVAKPAKGAKGATKAAPGKALTKSAIYAALVEKTGLTRKQVVGFFDDLRTLIEQQLGSKGPGVVAIPGLVKLQRIKKEARPATTKPNPFKPGEMMVVKARPASLSVKVRPLKDLKSLVK
jgi:nucleoid DNA-binding protein